MSKRKCRSCQDRLDLDQFDKTTNGNLKYKCRRCLEISEVNAWMRKPKGYNWLLGYVIREL